MGITKTTQPSTNKVVDCWLSGITKTIGNDSEVAIGKKSVSTCPGLILEGGSDPGQGLDGTPRDSDRPPGLSE